MTFEEIVNHRRAVRKYDPEKPIDAEVVKHCLEVASLAPTSSNMQLWEAYHITDKQMLEKMIAPALGQQAVKTAQQLVVFVTR